MLHKHLDMCRLCTTLRFPHTPQTHPLEHSYAAVTLPAQNSDCCEVCVPGGQELDEFVRLLVCLVGCVFEILQVVGCHQGQIPNTACSAATTQTGRGRVGGGAEAGVHHWRRLPLSQEVRCIYRNTMMSIQN